MYTLFRIRIKFSQDVCKNDFFKFLEILPEFKYYCHIPGIHKKKLSIFFLEKLKLSENWEFLQKNAINDLFEICIFLAHAIPLKLLHFGANGPLKIFMLKNF